ELSDFNDDRIPDVLTKWSYGQSIALGNGDGTFRADPVFDLPASLNSADRITASDYDGDGYVDLAVHDIRSGQIAILRGHGDGRPDLAVASLLSGRVFVLAGNGDGTFVAPQSYPVGDLPSFVAIGDLNCDGKMDLVVANSIPEYGGSSDLSVLLGRGDGTFG